MTGPHDALPPVSFGTPLAEATAAMVLVHGRGDSARGILGLAPEFGRPDLAYLAPQAAGWAWYPNSFLAPLDANEPGLSSGIRAVLRAVAEGHREIVAVVVATDLAEPARPCGACRQVLAEFGRDMAVGLVGRGDRIVRTTLSALLPEPFTFDDLA